MGFVEAERIARAAEWRHQAGDAIAAERLYGEALLACPGHARSLHGLGCLAHAAGRPDRAIGLIGQAVAAAPEVAPYMISLGLALLDQGHPEEARAALAVAVLRDETDARAHRALAQALSQLGRLEAAEASLRTAIALEPGVAAGHLSLGGVLRARGAMVEARAALLAATQLAPGDPLAWHALGALDAATGALEAAEAAFRRAAALLPDDPAAQANLGTALFGLDRLEAARPCLERARVLAPDNPATLSSLGLVLIGLGEGREAETVLAAASRLAPQSDAILINHGTALAALGQGAEAEALFRAVLSRAPTQVQAQARFNLATVLLARGARREGWAAFEARLDLPGSQPPVLPRWDGANVGENRILIRAEQGLGDSLQFLRWLPQAARRAAIRLELPAALRSLVRGLFDPARVSVAEPGTGTADCVAEASLLSLPYLLGDVDAPPLSIAAPHLAISATEQPRAGLVVGLAWAGSPSYRFDRARSIRLAQLAPLAAVPEVSFVSLQQGRAADEARDPPAGMRLVVPDPPPVDLAATASLIGTLDLVISVDTVVAHLAGALGAPAWLLDRFGGDWRWQAGFNDGRDWYPSLRRFAQTQALPPPRAWDEVIARCAANLSDASLNDARRPGRS